MDTDLLSNEWNKAAFLIDDDPMRPIRYGKGLKYLKDLPKESKILEIGYGEGTGLFLLNRLGFKNLFGIEVSSERESRAVSKGIEYRELKHIKPTDDIPFADQEFDVVVSFAVIEYVIDPKLFFKEVRRVLKTDAVAVVSSDCFSWRVLQMLGLYKSVQPIDKAMSVYEFFRIIKQSGFELLDFDSFNLPERGNIFLHTFKRIIHSITKYKSSKEVLPFETKFSRALGEPTPSLSFRRKLVNVILNFIDDENIFFVRKK